MIIGSTMLVTAQITEPTTIAPMENRITRRLPNMSASRPAIGIATAAVSRVDVMTQEALSGLVSRYPGSRPTIGTTRVCMNDASRPPKHNTAIRTCGSTGLLSLLFITCIMHACGSYKQVRQ